jgi:IclR family transcriptional regulator, KDG regulon repressor
MSQTLDRALTILDLVAERPQRINEIATALGVHPSTALRLLHTLRKHGFVRELDNHHYRLGPATFRLGFKALEEIDLRSVARPFMDELSDKTGETVHLGVLTGNDVVYIEKVEAKHPVRMYSRIGAIAPLHCTGVAKAILSFLPPDHFSRVIGNGELQRFTDHTLTTTEALQADLTVSRERGFALDDEEHETGIHCVAAPILSGDGKVLGALSVSGPTSRIDKATLMDFAPAVKEAAKETSEEFGWIPS